jgi:signal transduction histidine kinase
LPGATLAGVGLLRQARQVRASGLPKIANYLGSAAVAFLVYALVGGLIVPTAPVFPATHLNYSLLDRTIRIPAAVFRSACGLAMAFFVVRSLEIFQVEDDRRMADMERQQALVADRERIGRELHDGIIQNIYAAGLTLQDTEHLVVENPDLARHRIRTVMDALNRTVHDIRRYIFDLRAAEQSRELEVVLDGLVQELRLDTMLDVELEVQGQRCCWLSEQQVGHITQIAREALSNVVQHAGATHVLVGLSYLGNATSLTVEDNGHGLMSDSLESEGSGGHGVANMMARARMLGGELILEGEPGTGLCMRLTIPCAGLKDPHDGLEAQQAWT